MPAHNVAAIPSSLAMPGRGPTLLSCVRGTIVGVLGSVLLAAAAMKAYLPVADQWTRAGLLTNPWFVVVTVECEVALGIWLLSGINRHLAWHVALCCFIAFLAVAVHRGLAGATSCGCFGGLQVNPWHTAVFDATAAISLVMFRPPLSTAAVSAASRTRLLSAMAVLVMCAVGAGWIAFNRLPKALATEAEFAAAAPGSLVVLEPQHWVGKRFPLTRYIDLGSQFQAGRWLIVLYDADCAVCQRAIPHVEQVAQNGAVKVALIEMPPYQARTGTLAARHAACIRGRLSNGHQWFAVTPLAVWVEDSVVVGALQGEEVLTVRPNSFTQRSPSSWGFGHPPLTKRELPPNSTPAGSPHRHRSQKSLEASYPFKVGVAKYMHSYVLNRETHVSSARSEAIF